MHLLIAQILSGFSIGSLVWFDGKFHRIVDMVVVTPWSKGLMRTKWYKPFNVVLWTVNEYGGFDQFGHRVAKHACESGKSYSEIMNAMKL